MGDDAERIKKKALLQSYYQNNDNGQPDSSSYTTSSSSLGLGNSNSLNSKEQVKHSKDPYDLNATSFEADLFLKKLIKVLD
jgi:hypothetical protein